MTELLRLREVVLSLLEKPRKNKYVLFVVLHYGGLNHLNQRHRELKSSLMADVDIIIPNDTLESNRYIDLIKQEGR